MYLVIIVLPFIGSAISGLRGRALGSTGAQLVATFSVGISAMLSLVAFYEVALSRSPVSIFVGTWLDSDPLYAGWSFYYDDLTVAMLLPVLIVSTIVHIYSINYIAHDPHTPRFFSYLAFFTACMVLLVTGDSYAIIFLGWEGIGIASYLLIGFWLTRVQAQKSAIKALTVNRVGDTALSIGLFAMLWAVGSIEHATVLASAPFLNETTVTVLSLLLLGGAMSKSAQVPLHVWLADAMEGPTPVSALIHAATLVTAGVYLMLRTSPVLEYSSTALLVITWLGACTAFFSATCGLIAVDVKRVIAFSTCSQLGYMMIALGLSQYSSALFHLVCHAIFKALLFIAAGSVIHAIADQQDVRRLGGLVSFLPFTYVTMLVGSLSLMAIPGLTGFYSKDPILELAGGTYTISGTLVYIMGTLSAGITAYYSFRLINLVFFSTPSAPVQDYVHTHDAPFVLGIPLVFLAVFSIVFGYIAKDLWLGVGTDYLASAFHSNPNNVSIIEAEFALPTLIKLLPAIVTISGAFLSIYIYNNNIEILNTLTGNPLWRRVYVFINKQWFFNSVMTGIIIRPSMYSGFDISKIFDRGVLETVGPYGFSTILPKAGSVVARYDTSLVTSYALYVMLGLLSIMSTLFIPVFFTGGIAYGSSADHALVILFAISLLLLPFQSAGAQTHSDLSPKENISFKIFFFLIILEGIF